MFPKNETEFVMLNLIFDPSHTDNSDPIISSHRSTYNVPIRTLPVCNWFYHTMSKEYVKIPKDNNVLYTVWKIKSNDIGMFTINKIRFDNLLLFVGETQIHWIYYKMEPIFTSAKGITPLTLNYCNCCFYDQYPKFIKSIQDKLS